MTGDNGTRVALTIAGSDSGGGAGVQADLKTFSAHGVFGTSAVTAVTAQNTVGVDAVEVMPASLVARQIVTVVEDIGAHAVKTGMLATASIIGYRLREARLELGVEKTVVDPVMVAKSGDRLLELSAITALRDELIPRAFVVTPNLPEAESLVGFPCEDETSIRAAARRLVEMGAKAVVIKGGHGGGDESRRRLVHRPQLSRVPRSAGSYAQHARDWLYVLGCDCGAPRARRGARRRGGRREDLPDRGAVPRHRRGRGAWSRRSLRWDDAVVQRITLWDASGLS